MTLRGPVVVGTDLSPDADEALRQGAALAKGLDSSLIVCHVIPELLPDGSLFAEFRHANLEFEESILNRARSAVQQHLDEVLGADNANLAVVVDYGTPHAGLLSNAEETDAGVIVTGPGRVALDVVRHTSAAVLVARRSPRGAVIGATDFSDPSLPALQTAAFEARRRAVPLHLIHAFDMALFTLGQAPAAAMPYLAGSSPIALGGLDELRNQAKRRLDESLREANLPGEAVVQQGSAPDVIARYAQSVDAQLLVIGTHGRSGLARLTLGSTATSLIEQVPCSVLVVRLGQS